MLDFRYENKLEDMNLLVKFETLDTSFINLGALIRYLRQRNFVGRVKVSLEEYEADVFLHGAEEASIWEKNLATGRGAQGKDAMERLLVRARDPGGVITIYEGPSETTNTDPASGSPETPGGGEVHDETPVVFGDAVPAVSQLDSKEFDWDKLLAASGEVIAAVERAVQSANEDFGAHFRAALIALADDYPFLDPTAGGLQYSDAKVELRERPAASDYVSSLTESLRRVVNRVVVSNAGERFRERVAVEFVIVARRKENALAAFMPYLDRIAGARVL